MENRVCLEVALALCLPLRLHLAGNCQGSCSVLWGECHYRKLLFTAGLGVTHLTPVG
jgi:hypothetical protein